MSPDAERVDVPPEPAAVVRRYHRVERLVSGAFALVAAGIVAAAVFWLPLLHALVVSVALLAAVRLPVFRSRGSARLAIDASPQAVRADFDGPTPPVLATQWGVADEVRRTDDGAVYEVSYLFGLRSVILEVETREDPVADAPGGVDEPDADLELVVAAGGGPWATYAVSVDDRDGRTSVDVEFASDRRFGLRRLPQWLLARRYRDEVLAAQGYAVVERDVGLSIR